MKFKLLSLGLFSVSAVSPFLVSGFTQSAMACVAVDVNTQAQVAKDPGPQRNRVSQNLGPNCGRGRGGTAITRNRQTCIAPDGTCTQNRESEQNVDAIPDNRSNVRYPVVKFRINNQIRIRTPRVPSRRSGQ